MGALGFEAVFGSLKGVISAEPGYSGGHVPDPTYEQVCTDTTGRGGGAHHVRPAVISYEQLVEVFFSTHDPTTPNRQGEDVGTQYRSVIFYHSEEQRDIAERVREKAAKRWDSPIVSEISPLANFYPAEDYHRNYFAILPEQAYCRMVIAPKVAKFRAKYAQLLKG